VLADQPDHREAAGRLDACWARQRIGDLQAEMRLHASTGNWDAVLAASEELTALDPTAADPDGLASQARGRLPATGDGRAGHELGRDDSGQPVSPPEPPDVTDDPGWTAALEGSFVIELDGQAGSYRLHVSSPAGDAAVDVRLDPAQLGVDLDALQTRVLASATRGCALVPELERPLRQAGQVLFQAVFPASAGALFLSSRNEVEQAGGRLRILLRLHPPELAVLPWELLFSHDFGGYLCRRSPMVRYVDAPEPDRPLTVSPPLRVLGMTALPGDLAALDADTEQQRLRQLLAPLQARGLVTVNWGAPG
jgi:hypothetical protein